MKFSLVFSSFLFSILVSIPAKAIENCVGPLDQVELEGVLTEKATYVHPTDFGWVPENGFVAYKVLVLQEPVCYRDEEGQVEKTHILQVAGSNASTEKVLHEGVKVKLKGKIFPEHTAHHFQKLLIAIE